MKLLSVMIWLFLSQVSFAQTVIVKSGDHPGFTRLVLELPKVANWQMGRTDDGYALHMTDDALRFDLTGVFKGIQRDRLSAIWRDPASGDLHFGIACACHAMPFELRPGILVIDLRDGPAPQGSSFERTLEGRDTSELSARPAKRPRARPITPAPEQSPAKPLVGTYDWLAQPPAIRRPVVETGATIVMANIPYDTDITPLKDALLRQLSRGAAQGFVQMANPGFGSGNTTTPLPIGPRANIRLGEGPGFEVATMRKPANILIENGASSSPDEKLDVTGWGKDQPVSIQLAESRANLIGEFDRPNPTAVILAAKLLIYLSFGAEAKQLLAQIPVDDPDISLWVGMAGVVDGETGAGGPFQGMHRCDTAAALWASLAAPDLAKGGKPRAEAVLRAFSALPAHLRGGLGPGLAAKFLAIGDMVTARALSHSVKRGMVETIPEVVVMTAKLDLANGDAASAATQLASVLTDAGPAAADTLIALVDAQNAAGTPVDPQIPMALAALIHEQAGSDQEPALRRAQIIALGLSGDFDQAFGLLSQKADAEGELWALLAKSGSDTAILNHAVLPMDADLPAIPAGDRSQIAGHLLDLGVPDAALNWIGPQTDTTIEADQILAAKAALQQAEPDAALGWIAGLNDDAASEVRARALWQLGKPAEAAEAWADAGNTDAELRAQSWARNWPHLSTTGTDPWRAAATLLTTRGNQDGFAPIGPLAHGNALVAESAKARAALTALLA